MHRPTFLAWVFALALLSARASAVDDEPTNSRDLAQQRFREANEAYQDGRYSAAASLFEAADRLAPHPSTRFNAATSWEQAGEAARAATGYDAALSMNLLDEKRTMAEQRLAILKKSLARVRIQQPLGALVTVDHVQRAPVPTVFYLRPGTYTLAIEYRGTNSSSTARVFPGKDHELKLDLPGAEAAPAPPVSSPPFMRTVPPEPPPSSSNDGATQKTWGWVSVGAGVALSGAAIALGLRALAARDEFVASGNTNAEARGEASDLRLATNLLWGGATVAGVTGLVLLLTAPQVEF
jgi:tetratricopeptide (TPR) repeat protein